MDINMSSNKKMDNKKYSQSERKNERTGKKCDNGKSTQCCKKSSAQLRIY